MGVSFVCVLTSTVVTNAKVRPHGDNTLELRFPVRRQAEVRLDSTRTGTAQLTLDKVVRREAPASSSAAGAHDGVGSALFMNVTVEMPVRPLQVEHERDVHIQARMNGEEALDMSSVAPCGENVTVHGSLLRGLHIGKRSHATKACEDMHHAKWVNHKGKWMVESKSALRESVDTTYECGDCSVHCRRRADYHLNGIEKCDTRTLSSPKLINCESIGKKRKPIQLAFFGSSHTRVLFFHLYRLLADHPWPKKLPDYMTRAEAGGAAACYAHQNFSFHFCDGNLRIEIAFFFKHFYKLGGDDVKFLEYLEALNFRKPDLLVAEASIWSVFEKELLRNTRREKCLSMGGMCTERTNKDLTLESEQDEYLDWLLHHFGNNHTYTIIQLGSPESPNIKPFDNFMASFRRIGSQNPDWAACAFDKESLVPVPDDMVCAHGCDGPVAMIQAQAILRNMLLK